MLHGKKIVVVMPAYNAASTLERTYGEVPKDIVDEVILTDDQSTDETVQIAHRLNLRLYVHPKNLGYGGNQKTCYRAALSRGADIVVMVHPDYQYTPKLITAMSAMIASGEFEVVLGSRILGGQALAGGMPLYKYVSNRFLTAAENLLIKSKLSEFHTGYRAFTRHVLETLPLLENSDDFVFDNEMLVQCHYFGFRIAEISCPCRYNPDCSSINFSRSLRYGLGVLKTALRYRLQKMGLRRYSIFDPGGRKLQSEPPAPEFGTPQI